MEKCNANKVSKRVESRVDGLVSGASRPEYICTSSYIISRKIWLCSVNYRDSSLPQRPEKRAPEDVFYGRKERKGKQKRRL